jgi:hypothetical protein
LCKIFNCRSIKGVLELVMPSVRQLYCHAHI